MKKIILLVVVAFVAVSASAQLAPHLAEPGTELNFVTKNAKGEVQNYTTTVVDAVDFVDDLNYSVTQTVETFNADRTRITDPVTVTAKVIDGKIDMSSMMPPMPEGVDIELKFDGELPSMNANPAVGQVEEFNFSVDAGVFSMTAEGSVRVVAEESVTVPAGTFACFKGETEMTMSMMLMNIKRKTVTWTNDEVGVVRAETYKKNGKLETVQELVSYILP